jgi:DNA polymerase-3 subunit epsilon
MSAPTETATAESRKIIVVDVETTGLYPERHTCIEVAWWNLTSDERGTFIPTHSVSAALGNAAIEALRLNRYIDRIAGHIQDDGTEVRRLAEQLHGNTLAGSNPSFDAAFLRSVFADYEARELSSWPEWHHRLWDLAPYAAGVLGLDHLPGLAEVCERLDLWQRPDHSAESDVTVAGMCFRLLFERAGKAVAR